MVNQYVLILLWLGLMALVQQYFYKIEYNIYTNNYVYRVNHFFGFLVLLPVIIMATNRGWWADSWAYINAYQDMPTMLSGVGSYIKSVNKDKGFYFATAIIKVILGSDYRRYFLVIAIFQAWMLFVFFRKYTPSYVFAIFLFVSSTDYISWMFNGMRQFVAVAISLCATPFILKKQYIKAIIIVIVAATMHQSALVMIPILLISQGSVWNKRTMSFIISSLLVIVFVERFTVFLDDVLSSTQYANVVTDYIQWNDDGTNPLRVIVYSIPAILAFFGRKKIREYSDPVINLAANMSIVSMGLYLISMVTSGIFIGRLPIYVSLYGYILLPWEIEHLFTEKNRQFVFGVAILCYLGFYYYGMHFQNGLI